MVIFEEFEGRPEILVGGYEIVGEHLLDGVDEGRVQFGGAAAQEDDHGQQVVGGLDPTVDFLVEEGWMLRRVH